MEERGILHRHADGRTHRHFAAGFEIGGQVIEDQDGTEEHSHSILGRPGEADSGPVVWDAKELERPFTTKERAGRAIAAALGYEGRAGGWIYGPGGRPICQGYSTLAARFGASRFDAERKAYPIPAGGIRRILEIIETRRSPR